MHCDTRQMPVFAAAFAIPRLAVRTAFVLFALSLAAASLLLPSTSITAQNGIPGDVDGSGAVTAVDVQLVILCALGVSPHEGCDITGSGSVTADDVQWVINAALGIPVDDAAALKEYTYRVINSYPHDPAAFTQGLKYEHGILYESTGQHGQSSLRQVMLETGAVVQQHNLAFQYFGEGIAIVGDRIYQLTWRSGKCFVYNKHTFALEHTFTYTGEGWGLTYDGTHLIMSDGSAALRFIDPATFQEVRRVTVEGPGGPVFRLNELDYIDGEVYANVWMTDTIVRIHPVSGRLTGRIDLAGILTAEDRGGRQVDVLNGVTYIPGTDRLLVTGKLWPKLYEIELILVDN